MSRCGSARPFPEVKCHNQTLRIVSALVREYRVFPPQQPKVTNQQCKAITSEGK